jgi:hypothetical protein
MVILSFMHPGSQGLVQLSALRLEPGYVKMAIALSALPPQVETVTTVKDASNLSLKRLCHNFTPTSLTNYST